jgi:hypothetical protein
MARREELIAYLFISPWIIGFLVLLRTNHRFDFHRHDELVDHSDPDG